MAELGVAEIWTLGLSRFQVYAGAWCMCVSHQCQGVLQGLRNLIKAYLFGRKGIGTIREQY